MSTHNVLYELYTTDHRVPDPGDAGTITMHNKSDAVCPIVTAAAETRTLGNPEKAGLRLALFLKTDGGDCTVTASSAVNQAGDTTFVLDDAGDYITLESIEDGSSYEWRVVKADGVSGLNETISTDGTITAGTINTGGKLTLTDGGTITQATNKTTGVTLNTHSGQITMNGAALAAGAEATFTVTNSTVAATDVVVACHGSAGTSGAYLVSVTAVAAGSFDVTVSNVSAGSLSEAIVINYAVIGGASS